MALSMCRMTGIAPSLLLHPLDFMGCDDDADLAFFPAMGRPAEPKLELVSWMIEQMSKHYDVRPMKDHAASIVQSQPGKRSGQPESPTAVEPSGVEA